MKPGQDEGYWVGFDLGGTRRQAARSIAGSTSSAAARKNLRGNEGAEAGVERIVSSIEKLSLKTLRFPPASFRASAWDVPARSIWKKA